MVRGRSSARLLCKVAVRTGRAWVLGRGAVRGSRGWVSDPAEARGQLEWVLDRVPTPRDRRWGLGEGAQGNRVCATRPGGGRGSRMDRRSGRVVRKRMTTR